MGKFEESKEKGIHHKLSLMQGEWEGMTKTWHEPGKPPDESPMQGTIKVIFDGRFIQYTYKGSIEGQPFDGIAIWGYSFAEGKMQCAWIDSYHMGTGILYSEGDAEPSDKKFKVSATWGISPGSERWGWRTELEMPTNDELVITAYVITPDGDETKGVETVYKRKK